MFKKILFILTLLPLVISAKGIGSEVVPISKDIFKKELPQGQ